MLLVTIMMSLYHAQACPTECNCKIPKTVSCRNRELRQFPSGVPTDTEDLVLTMNPLGHLNQTHLSRLTSLKHLDISACSIQYLAPDILGVTEFGISTASS